MKGQQQFMQYIFFHYKGFDFVFPKVEKRKETEFFHINKDKSVDSRTDFVSTNDSNTDLHSRGTFSELDIKKSKLQLYL